MYGFFRVYWCILDGAECNTVHKTALQGQKPSWDQICNKELLHWRANDFYHGSKGILNVLKSKYFLYPSH